MTKTKSIQDQTFLFTGTLTEFTREEAEALVESNGGKVLSGVSAKLNYLVVGADAGSKLDKAKALGTVKILTEKEFLKMVPKTAANKSSAKDTTTAKKTSAKKEVSIKKIDSDSSFEVVKTGKQAPFLHRSTLGRTENQILENDFNWSKIDINAASEYFNSADYNSLHLFIADGVFTDNANEYFNSDFFEIFNPDVIYFIMNQAVNGYIKLIFSTDPTDYIIDDYGRLNRNMMLTFEKSDTDFQISLEREFFYDYDDVEDEEIIKKIIKMEKKDKSNKSWPVLSIHLNDDLNANKISAMMKKQFKSNDIWI